MVFFIERTSLTSYGEVGDNVPTSQRRVRLVNGEVTRFSRQQVNDVAGKLA